MEKPVDFVSLFTFSRDPSFASAVFFVRGKRSIFLSPPPPFISLEQQYVSDRPHYTSYLLSGWGKEVLKYLYDASFFLFLFRWNSCCFRSPWARILIWHNYWCGKLSFLLGIDYAKLMVLDVDSYCANHNKYWTPRLPSLNNNVGKLGTRVL